MPTRMIPVISRAPKAALAQGLEKKSQQQTPSTAPVAVDCFASTQSAETKERNSKEAILRMEVENDSWHASKQSHATKTWGMVLYKRLFLQLRNQARLVRLARKGTGLGKRRHKTEYMTKIVIIRQT